MVNTITRIEQTLTRLISKEYLKKRSFLKKYVLFFLSFGAGLIILNLLYPTGLVYPPLLTILISSIVFIYCGSLVGVIFLITFALTTDYFYTAEIKVILRSKEEITQFILTIILGLSQSFLFFFGQKIIAEFTLKKIEADKAKVEAAHAKDIADQAIKSRDEMLGIISHELKNPLTSMALSSHLIQKILSKETTSEKVLSLIKSLDPSIQRMNKLVSDLLDVTRLESQALQCEPKLISLSNIIEEVIGIYMATSEGKNILISSQISRECTEIFSDEIRTIQILSNLVSNAIKFTEPGGKIKLDAVKSGEMAEISVTDNGKGIPEKKLSRVFEKFWQEKDSEHIGTGLGLAIAKGLVESLGGRIWVESKVGQGSSFHFTLPLSGEVKPLLKSV
jgi:signal transduction histidine kinase